MTCSASSFDTPSLTAFGGVVDQVLGLLQAQAGDLADHLDDLDLLGAGCLEDNVELRLLLDGLGRGTGAGAAGRGSGHDGGDVELLLELLHEVSQLEDGHVADGVEQFLVLAMVASSCDTD